MTDLRKVSSVRLYVSGKKGLSALEAFALHNKNAIQDVIYAPDSNVTDDYSDLIKQFCQEENIPSHQRTKESEGNHDFALCAGWRWLTPVGRSRILVIHDSVLPSYRGFNPLVTALINGDNFIGASLFESTFDGKPDSGPILLAKKSSITYPIKISTAVNIVSEIYGELITELLQSPLSETLSKAKKQDDSNATYSLWRDDHDYWINWSQDSEVLERFVNAVGEPYLGARTSLQGQEIVVREVSQCEDLKIVNRTPGKVLRIEDGLPVVVCGTGLVKIHRAERIDTLEPVLPFSRLRTRLG